MLASRLLVFPALLAVAAGCATSGYSGHTSVTPERGPMARIHATYSGGLTQRSLRANFTVDQTAYVLVGHLGGDGVIEILYPENARLSNLARRGKTYSVGPVSANYDGVPQLFSYTSRAFRNPGARMDSYDGRGNGFVFIIASRVPLYLDDLQAHGYWNNDYEVEDYSWTSDPRQSIKYFADGVAGGGPYTLKYANSFGTNAMLSYAANQYDCALISQFYGYGSMFLDPGFGYWGSSFSSFSWYYNRPMGYYGLANSNWYAGYGALGAGYSGCGRQYSLGYLLGSRPSWSYSPTYFAVPTVGNAPAPPAPPGPTSGNKRLPGIRPGAEPGPGPGVLFARTHFDRPREATQPTWRPERPTHEPERYRPSTPDASHYTPRVGTHDATPRVGAPAQTPAASTPNSPPPKVAASSGKPREP